MRMTKTVSMRLAALLVAAAFVFSLAACGEARSAYSIMERFLDGYGVSAVIYSPSLNEGEDGYVGEDFFSTLFIYGEEYVKDYATVLLSDVFSVSECSVILCDDEYGAEKISGFCKERLQLLSRVSKMSGIGFPDGAFVKRYGRAVVLCALSDSARARRIFDGIF